MLFHVFFNELKSVTVCSSVLIVVLSSDFKFLLCFSILSVFVVALIICLDGGILGVCYIIITFEIINMIGSVVFCHKIVGLSVYSWLNMVLKKAIIALIISALVALIIELSITADFIWTHLLKCFLLFVSTGCICWFTLIEENERIQLLKLVGKIKRMFV